MSVEESQTMIDALKDERSRLDNQLDEALHAFAEYEEGMNVRWHTADPAARQRLVSAFDLELTQPDHALGFRFDIVLRGRAATPMEDRP